MRLSFVRVTVVATLLSLGCGNDAVCQSRIAAMRTALATLLPPGEDQDAHGMMSIGYIIPLPALASAAGQPTGGGRLLYVYADGTRNFEGTPLASDGELDIVVATQGAREFGPPEPIHLALEPGTKIRDVVPLLRLAKRAPLYVLFRVPVDAQAPAIPPALAAKIEATHRDPRGQSAMFDATLKAAIGGCDPIERGFVALSDWRSNNRRADLLNAVVIGAESCGCNTVDVDTLLVLLWWTFQGHGPVHVLPLAVDPAGTRLAPDAGVEDLVKALATGPIALDALTN